MFFSILTSMLHLNEEIYFQIRITLWFQVGVNLEIATKYGHYVRLE